MSQAPLPTGKYSYRHHDQKGSSQGIDIHDIFITRSKVRVLLSYLGILLLLANTCHFLLIKEKSVISSTWNMLWWVLFAKFLQYKPVKKDGIRVTGESLLQGLILWKGKNAAIPSYLVWSGFIGIESVVIMPAFGLQLETHFWSGRVTRRFVPFGKILRPVLNECVTPITCHWNLALILRDEEELILVFQELQPPVKMLVPVWKALCAASNCEDQSSSL